MVNSGLKGLNAKSRLARADLPSIVGPAVYNVH